MEYLSLAVTYFQFFQWYLNTPYILVLQAAAQLTCPFDRPCCLLIPFSYFLLSHFLLISLFPSSFNHLLIFVKRLTKPLILLRCVQFTTLDFHYIIIHVPKLCSADSIPLPPPPHHFFSLKYWSFLPLFLYMQPHTQTSDTL